MPNREESIATIDFLVIERLQNEAWLSHHANPIPDLKYEVMKTFFPRCTWEGDRREEANEQQIAELRVWVSTREEGEITKCIRSA